MSNNYTVILNEQQLNYIKKAIQLVEPTDLFELETFVSEEESDEVGDVLCSKIDTIVSTQNTQIIHDLTK